LACRKANPGTRILFTCCQFFEHNKNTLKIFRRNSNAVILHGENPFLPSKNPRDMDTRFCFAIL